MSKPKEFDYGNANDQQKEAINHTEGPLLITAGPGTGKTFTLVKRIAFLIQEKGVKPEEIMVATFTEKAAKELVTRITNELAKLDREVNLNEMYIGTFHSICLRFVKEHMEYTRVKKNFRLLDAFDQKYLIMNHRREFSSLPNYDQIHFESYMGPWKRAGIIAGIISNLTEELVDVDKMLKDKDPKVNIAAKMIKMYQKLLKDENLLDFTGIQVEAYRLFIEHPEILKDIQKQIKYIMVDEYQDTNYIQEQIVFLLAGKKKNICVVGDDDQGLYRFRGATIRNILEFPGKFKKGECKQVDLTINYRSEKQIIDFYNNWMVSPAGFSWGNCRFPKTIKPGKKRYSKKTTVLKCFVNTKKEWGKRYWDRNKRCEQEWCKEVHRFISTLKDQNVITNYNQVAFLGMTVRHSSVINLINYLDDNGIPVYSPRSDMFFGRKEIQNLLGILIMCFPDYLEKLKKNDFKYKSKSHIDLYLFYRMHCVEPAKLVVQAHDDLKRWLDSVRKTHSSMKENTNYAFSGLLYQILEFEPFKSYIGVEIGNGVIDERSARNISIFSAILGKYEYLHSISVFSKDNIKEVPELFFNRFLKYLYEGGIEEYEDDSEYAPSGCVSFLTIHQAKGMEFPIVMVDPLYHDIKEPLETIIDKVEEKKYLHRQKFEDSSKIPYYDYWRLYYTAFSRAQNLLILTCFEREGKCPMPGAPLKPVINSLPAWNSVDLSRVKLESVKPVNLKKSYSFTSHIELYENCPRQYKYFKELGFTPVRVGSTMFGTLVHETIEDVHRAAIRHETDTITNKNIRTWLNRNYSSLQNSMHAALGKEQINAAYRQVLKYVKKMQNGTMPISIGGRKKKVSLWDYVQEAEYNVSEVRPDYILKGTVDLIRGNENTVEIVDFKTSKKPENLMQSKQAERFRRQLEIYAHLVEKRTGKKVSRMHLYYTGEETTDPLVTFENSKKSVTKTIKEFDEVVSKIQQHDFSKTCNDKQICDNCDMRYYCGKVKRKKK